MARQVPSKVNDPASASNPLPANPDDLRNPAPESAAENEAKPLYSAGAQEEIDSFSACHAWGRSPAGVHH